MFFISGIPRIITIEKCNFLIPLIMFLPHVGKHSPAKNIVFRQLTLVLFIHGSSGPLLCLNLIYSVLIKHCLCFQSTNRNVFSIKGLNQNKII